MGVSEMFLLGQIDSQTKSSQETENTINQGTVYLGGPIENKVHALLDGQWIPLQQHTRVVERHNLMAKAFRKSRTRDLAKHQSLEGALLMIQELTGKERDDILNKVDKDYSILPDAVKITGEYKADLEKEDKEMGLY